MLIDLTASCPNFYVFAGKNGSNFKFHPYNSQKTRTTYNDVLCVGPRWECVKKWPVAVVKEQKRTNFHVLY